MSSFKTDEPLFPPAPKHKHGGPNVLHPEAKKKKLIKRKPARKQVEAGQVEKKAPEQTGTTFNLWYGKWAGGDKYDAYNAKDKAQTRVNVEKDSGYTRADGTKNPYICMFFARGCCPYGHECSYLHRLPSPNALKHDSARDIFGREKHADYRDDMGGVGTFNRQNKTLYVGKLKETADTAEMIERHFEEFGDIERIKILQSRGVAFVTYVHESHAQFAKEAMMHQSLDSDEVLNVRWATEDPNKTAQGAYTESIIQQGEQGIAEKLEPEFVEHVRQLDELEGLTEPAPAYDPTQDPDDVRYKPPSAAATGTVAIAGEIEAAPPAKAPTTTKGKGKGKGKAAASGKRTRAAAAEPNSKDDDEQEAPPAKKMVEAKLSAPSAAPLAKPGLLDASALSSLKALAALRQKQQQQQQQAKS